MPALIACPFCQNQISERANKCPKCGRGQQKRCLVCKKIIMLDGISCPECGDPDPFNEQFVRNNRTKKIETKITAITIPDQDNEKEFEKHIKTPQPVNGRRDSGSKQWSIYTKGGRIVAVKHGFCWPAFFFTFGWAIFNRLWGIAISYFIFINFTEFMIYDTLGSMNFEFYSVQFNASYIFIIILEFIFRFSFGNSGNKLLASRLEKNGFWESKSLNAKNKQSAIERYKH